MMSTHLFHWIRMEFLNEYQRLILHESDSAVSQSLKEVFLALRRQRSNDRENTAELFNAGIFRLKNNLDRVPLTE